MTTKPNGMDNIVASTTSTNGTNGHQDSTDYLDPSTMTPTNGRLRVASSEDVSEDFNHSGEFGEQWTGRSDVSLNPNTYKMTCRDRIRWYLNIAIEGDLAGFQIAWLLMSIGFIILKIFNITEVIQRIQWWAIFIIPVFNALLTAWFDYIIRQYRSTHTVESLKKSRFVVLWLIKLIMAIYVTTYWVWGPGSFMERYRDDEDFQSMLYLS